MVELAQQFVPAADEVWRLQNDAGAECVWFRSAVRGRPDPSAGTMQGIYVLTPGGKRLGSLNSLNPDAVLGVLTKALESWAALSPEERSVDPKVLPSPEHRWEHSCPEDGLILERFARDVGEDPSAEVLRPVNRDALWFTAAEARSLLPEQLVKGGSTEAPAVAHRMARLSLVDNVRGQTLPFSPEEVEGTLRSEVVSVDGSRITLQLSGSTRAVAPGPWSGGDNYWKPRREWPRSVETDLLGSAVYDRATGRFVAFELVALGWRKGRTGLNGRYREKGEEPRRIGFLIRLAPEGWRVAPTFINVYDADWVVQPG